MSLLQRYSADHRLRPFVGKGVRMHFSRKINSFLIILTFIGYAHTALGINIDIAGETIRIPSPDGYTEVRSVSQETFSYYEDMCHEINRLCAFFVTREDSVKLISGMDVILSEFITVQTCKKQEDKTVTKYEFAKIRDMFRNDNDSILQNKDETDNQHYRNMEKALSKWHGTEIKFDINGVAPLGIDVETATSISMSAIQKQNISMHGKNKKHLVAVTFTSALVKNKILNFYVHRIYQDEKDVDWTRLQSKKWMQAIFAANEVTWPSSKGVIVPEGTPIDDGIMELMTETQVEYNMKLHPKAHGLDISIKYPESWKAEEGIRPHFVKKFIGNPVAGIFPICMLIVKDIPPWGSFFFESKIGDSLLPEMLSEMAPPEATYIDGGATQIDGESGAWIKCFTPVERAGLSFGVYTLEYLFFYGGKMIEIQCAVGGSAKDKVMLEDAFTSYLPIFQMIGNSVVINEKWAQSDHYSLREHVTGWLTVIIIIVIPTIFALGFGVIRPKKIAIKPTDRSTPLAEKDTSAQSKIMMPPPIPRKSSKPPPLPKQSDKGNA
jgi:hypothetical protein